MLDLKPANIFVLQHDDKPDFVKIVDFGIAKETADSAPGGAGEAAADERAAPMDLTAATGGVVGTDQQN